MKTQIQILKQCLSLLSKSASNKIYLVLVVQILLGILDLIGVVILGILGSIVVNGINLGIPGNRVKIFLELLNLQDNDLMFQVLILSLISISLLVGKTFLSLYFTKRILFFLALQGAQLSVETTRRFFRLPLGKINQRNNQEIIYSLTAGMNVVTVGVIGAAILLISDITLLLILFLGLCFVDPIIASTSIAMFLSIGYLLYLNLNKKAHALGLRQSELHIESQNLINQVLISYREIVVKNRKNFFMKKVQSAREGLSKATASLAFQQNISKFVLEISILIGTMVIAGIQFALQAGSHALVVLSIFLAASTRIAPAVMRVQQGMVQIKGNVGTAKPSLDLISELANSDNLMADIAEDSRLFENFNHEGFDPELELVNVSFKYPNSNLVLLANTNLKIKRGSLVAILGDSGEGKSTLADLMLGVIEPSEGYVQVSGISPREAINRWPGAIAYVPQEVPIYDGTIKDNICFGYDFLSDFQKRIYECLELSSLSDFVASLPKNIDTEVGDRGTSLSGGQKQRLGIARALFTNPRLILFDESTSSLDGKTESLITDSISSLRGNSTVIIIAHRLATIRNADLVIYLKNHKVDFVGSFEKLRESRIEFDLQARVMGL